jgi:heat shock protein HslJ
MYQMKALGVLSIFILLLTTNSCNEARKVINLVSDVQLNGSYAIVNIGGEVVRSDNTKKVFIDFNSTDKSIRGNTGCNSYFGNYMLDQYSMSFSDIGQTERL